jgi:hypothetical protein
MLGLTRMAKRYCPLLSALDTWPVDSVLAGDGKCRGLQKQIENSNAQIP